MSLTDIFRSGSRTSSGSLLDRDFGEKLLEPAPSWRYFVEFPQIDGFKKQMAQSWVVAEEFTLNHVHIPAQGRFSGGSMIYFPDFTDISGTDIVLYEDVHYNALDYILKWKKKIVDKFGNYAPANEYKRPINLNLFSYTNSSSPVFIATLKGCWPTEISSHSYSYENGDRVKTTVQFSVDDITYDFIGMGQDGSGKSSSILNQAKEEAARRASVAISKTIRF